MGTAYDGRQVVGMDLHRRRSVLVRMTEDGRRLATTRISNSPAELRKAIAWAGKNPRVVTPTAIQACLETSQQPPITGQPALDTARLLQG
jgi:hypothetical protein